MDLIESLEKSKQIGRFLDATYESGVKKSNLSDIIICISSMHSFWNHYMNIVISGAKKYGYQNIEDPLRPNWKWQGVVFNNLKCKLSERRAKVPHEYDTIPYYWEDMHAAYSNLR